MKDETIQIVGACEHNLKSVTLSLPKRKLIVFSGVSGSGKSSLAFDTLYAEGQRRYVESLSSYARQFLGQMDKPKYEAMRGLSPTISIEQKTTGNNPRSTVGTITEIWDYMRVLYARVGTQYCPDCGGEVKGQSAAEISNAIQAKYRGKKLNILSPLIKERKGEHREILLQVQSEGFARVRIDGETVRLEDVGELNKKQKHSIDIIIDRVEVGKTEASRISEAVEIALRYGKKSLLIHVEGSNDEDELFSEERVCPKCIISFPELSPQSFSFNHPLGMCPGCDGLGKKIAMDPERVIPNRDLSLDDGAIAPWGKDVSGQKRWDHGFRGQVLEQLGIPFDVPINKLKKKPLETLLYGTGETTYEVDWESKSGTGTFQVKWEGVLPRLFRRMDQTSSERAKNFYTQFLGEQVCHECHGERLNANSRAVRLGDDSIVEISSKSIENAERSLRELKLEGAREEIAGELRKEILGRLGFLLGVGLGYLSLDRSGPTLSGGESQRIRLASQIGSELTGVTYVLDEPSIGLHQRDNQRLVKTLEKMRDLGNTVICVEHDEDTIRAADHIVDFGPGAGVQGGNVIFEGTPKQLCRSSQSLTGKYLSGALKVHEISERRIPKHFLKMRGVSSNNLKNLDVDIPLGVMCCITGVSGAGKSTLINDVLYPELAHRLNGADKSASLLKKLEGIERLDKVIDIDQKPIGRTPRSNPATYVKLFDEIRTVFAGLPLSKARGYKSGRFSFNVKGGRCEACEGDGVKKVEMHFLADVYVRCDVCEGKRFNDATLEVKYKGKSIADILELSVAESIELFGAFPKLIGGLKLLSEVGLEYMPLGQPSPTLSGGEAQRIKLSRELAKRSTGKTLYVLDEPTTGLHFDDIRKLLLVLTRLVDAGNSVILIEHNIDVIRAADYLIDMGPDGGPGGGQVIATGTPEAVSKISASHTGVFLR